MVECNLAKVEVAGSNPVSRSNFYPLVQELEFPFILQGRTDLKFLESLLKCPASGRMQESGYDTLIHICGNNSVVEC